MNNIIKQIYFANLIMSKAKNSLNVVNQVI